MPTPHAAALPDLELYGRGHALAMLLAAATSLAIESAWPAAVTGAASLVACLVLHRGRWTPAGVFGAANALTLLRLLLIVALVPLCARPPGPAAALLVLAVFALDGADGFVARRRGEASHFGAYFDMESDALLVLLCSLVLHQHARVGAFILLPGLLRYVYVVLLALLPAAGEAPRSRLGRGAFGAMLVSFSASLWPLEPLHRPLAAALTAVLVYSFAVSLYLARKRA